MTDPSTDDSDFTPEETAALQLDGRDPAGLKHVVCSICDIGCQLRAEAGSDGRLGRILAHEDPFQAANICFKGTAAPQIQSHPDRLRVPLKRVGPRGADRWEEIGHDQAIAEIAARLHAVVERHGPEAWAVSTSGWNTQTSHGLDRRLMNLVGSPSEVQKLRTP